MRIKAEDVLARLLERAVVLDIAGSLPAGDAIGVVPAGNEGHGQAVKAFLAGQNNRSLCDAHGRHVARGGGGRGAVAARIAVVYPAAVERAQLNGGTVRDKGL